MGRSLSLKEFTRPASLNKVLGNSTVALLLSAILNLLYRNKGRFQKHISKPSGNLPSVYYGCWTESLGISTSTCARSLLKIATQVRKEEVEDVEIEIPGGLTLKEKQKYVYKLLRSCITYKPGYDNKRLPSYTADLQVLNSILKSIAEAFDITLNGLPDSSKSNHCLYPGKTGWKGDVGVLKSKLFTFIKNNRGDKNYKHKQLSDTLDFVLSEQFSGSSSVGPYRRNSPYKNFDQLLKYLTNRYTYRANNLGGFDLLDFDFCWQEICHYTEFKQFREWTTGVVSKQDNYITGCAYLMGRLEEEGLALEWYAIELNKYFNKKKLKNPDMYKSMAYMLNTKTTNAVLQQIQGEHYE